MGVLDILDSITTGVKPSPPRVMVHAEQKLGKSLFASKFPDPIFIDIENGLKAINTTKLRVTSFEDVVTALHALNQRFEGGDNTYKTIVIDTADALFELAGAHAAKSKSKSTFSDLGMSGYRMVTDRFKEVLNLLDIANEQYNKYIVITAQTKVKPKNEINIEQYDRQTLAIATGTATLLKSWVDIYGYADFETFVTSSGQVSTTDKRIFHVQNEQKAFDAGNRLGLVEPIPLEFSALKSALNTFYNQNKKEKKKTKLTAVDSDAA